MKLAVVIAAYNEAERLGSVLATLPRQLADISDVEIVVVNDGSSDFTANVAADSGVTVLSHKINRGQGAALQTGFDYARRQAKQIVVTFDADGQHCPEEIPDIIHPILTDEADIVLGSRFLDRQPENITAMRRMTLKGGVAFTRMVSQVKITDTHNGFRALGPRALDTISIKHDKMEHASEIIDQVGTRRLRYVEVPVTIRYTDYSMAKGQRNSAALRIAAKILIDKYLL